MSRLLVLLLIASVLGFESYAHDPDDDLACVLISTYVLARTEPGERREVEFRVDGGAEAFRYQLPEFPRGVVSAHTVRIVLSAERVWASLDELHAWEAELLTHSEEQRRAAARDGFAEVAPLLRREMPLLTTDLEQSFIDRAWLERPLECSWPEGVESGSEGDWEHAVDDPFQLGEPDRFVFGPQFFSFSEPGLSADGRTALMRYATTTPFGSTAYIAGGYALFVKERGQWRLESNVTTYIT